MRLTKKKQRLALLEWIAEGLSSTEIDAKAAEFTPPFSVTRQQVQYYKSTRDLQLKAIKEIDEKTALTEGYAVKEHRVYKLSLLAALMERDLLGGIIWTNQVKGIGGAENFEVIEYEEFNKAEIDAYRGVLEDIAAETGGRSKSLALTGAIHEIDYSIFDIDELTRITNGESETVVYADALKRIAAGQSQSST